MYNSEKYGWYVLNIYDVMKVFVKKKYIYVEENFVVNIMYLV